MRDNSEFSRKYLSIESSIHALNMMNGGYRFALVAISSDEIPVVLSSGDASVVRAVQCCDLPQHIDRMDIDGSLFSPILKEIDGTAVPMEVN